MIAFPQSHDGVVLMTNGDNGLKVCERILNEIIGGAFHSRLGISRSCRCYWVFSVIR